MRSAGCVINDLADTEIDKHVERRTKRHLAPRALKERGFGISSVSSFNSALSCNQSWIHSGGMVFRWIGINDHLSFL